MKKELLATKFKDILQQVAIQIRSDKVVWGEEHKGRDK